MASGTIEGAHTADDLIKPRAPRVERVLAEIIAEGGDGVEAKILHTLAVPGNYKLSKVEICRIAGVDVSSYRRLRQSAEFRDKMRFCLQDSVGDLTGPLRALEASASDADPKSCGDRRTLFEIAGLLGKSDVNVQVNTQVNIEQRLGLTPPAQLLWMYIQCNWPQSRWLPGILDAYLHGVPPLKPSMPPLPVPGVPEITEEERAADVHPAAIAGPVTEGQGEHSYLIDADVETLRPLVRQLETMREEMGPASSAALDCLLRLISQR